MSGSVHDIDLSSFIIYSSVFTQDRDSPFPLEIIGVHDPFLYCLIFAKYTALPEQTIYQCGFAVVNMGDDRHVSDIFSFLLH